jgi:uncharacterized 2Fe-2S/4Fe-4S cluster protein (DUF4445 family)
MKTKDPVSRNGKMNRSEAARAKELIQIYLICQAVSILGDAGIDVPVNSERLRQAVAAGLEAIRVLAQNPIAQRNPAIVAEFYCNYLKACFLPEESPL